LYSDIPKASKLIKELLSPNVKFPLLCIMQLNLSNLMPLERSHILQYIRKYKKKNDDEEMAPNMKMLLE